MYNKKAYKMGKKIFRGIIVFFVILVFGSGFAVGSVVSYGPNWESVCEGGICQTTLYSYEKYWRNENNRWEDINESFYDCSERGETKFCTNPYHFDVVVRGNGTVSAFLNNEDFTFKLSNFLGLNLNFNPSVERSVLTYEDVVPNYIDLRYQYLPTKLKEEIIIKQPLPNLPNRDFNISFTKSGSAPFAVLPSIICDANFFCEEMQHWITNDKIIIQVPIRFLTNPEVRYPVVIDPTIVLGSSDISWNGYVRKYVGQAGVTTYTRYNNPSPLLISSGLPLLELGDRDDIRGDIDWNISSVPQNSDINSLKLQLYVSDTDVPGGDDFNAYVYQMDGNNQSYPDTTGDCQGNCQFYNDMGAGALYNKTLIQSIPVIQTFSLSEQSLTDFEDRLSKGILFSTGLLADINSIVVASRDDSNAARRPRLTVKYFPTSSRMQRFSPIADISVNSYGDIIPTAQLWIGIKDNGDEARFFMKFELTDVNVLTMVSARIIVHTGGSAGSPDFGGTLHDVSNDSWTENMTWLTQPTIGSELAIVKDGTVAPNYYDWNVTDTVKGQGNGTYSFAFKCTHCSSGGGGPLKPVKYYSKDADTAYKPYLIIETAAAPSVAHSGTSYVIAGAGDIAGGGDWDEKTAQLLDDLSSTQLNAVFTAGDNAYPDGNLWEYNNYYDPTWGRHKSITKPTLGNHEYHLDNGVHDWNSFPEGYAEYFGPLIWSADTNGTYSYNIGKWHVIALNSECRYRGPNNCGPNSLEYQWLANDLAQNTKRCTLAYMHHPRFSGGADHGTEALMKPIWDLLFEYGVDVVVGGHNHVYERYELQDPYGITDFNNGIRQFVVGTGGGAPDNLRTAPANTVTRQDGNYGVLKLTLYDYSYKWDFLPIQGQTYTDSGEAYCN